MIFVFPDTSSEIYYPNMENRVLEENKIVCKITTSSTKITEPI